MNEPTTVPNEDKEMSLINRLARRELSPEEVYTFPVILCDNETDRDHERFSTSALTKLAELFVGKTGIFDHDPSGRNQTARIYTAEVKTDPTRITASGEVYTYVRAKAYMMRTDSNADFIKEIDGGIRKEVSVGCSISKRTCSICGSDRRSSPCRHIKGSVYGGKQCEDILSEPTDAYEWSFVAVPAQPSAGVTKSHSEVPETQAMLSIKKQLSENERELTAARSDITSEIIRLGQFCIPAYRPDTIKALCSAMSITELLTFKEQTRKNAISRAPSSVLSGTAEPNREKNRRFKLNV